MTVALPQRTFAMNATAADLEQGIRPIHRLIGQYAESHRNPTNVLIHWICVPIIVWCSIALVFAIHPWLAYAGCLAALGWYLRLSVPMALVMAAFAAASLGSMAVVPKPLWVAAVLFVVTWIAQFYGHHVEGKKPSFLEDLSFLLVGPLFLLAKAFRRFGLRF